MEALAVLTEHPDYARVHDTLQSTWRTSFAVTTVLLSLFFARWVGGAPALLDDMLCALLGGILFVFVGYFTPSFDRCLTLSLSLSLSLPPSLSYFGFNT